MLKLKGLYSLSVGRPALESLSLYRIPSYTFKFQLASRLAS